MEMTFGSSYIYREVREISISLFCLDLPLFSICLRCIIIISLKKSFSWLTLQVVICIESEITAIFLSALYKDILR